MSVLTIAVGVTCAVAAALVLIYVALLITRPKGTGLVTPTSVTAGLDVTSTVPLLPSDTPTPVITPTPDALELLKTAHSCKLMKEAVIRLRPSNTSSGAQIGAGTFVSVTARSLDTADWYEVVSGSALRYVEREAVECVK
jgi:hypothetical protein